MSETLATTPSTPRFPGAYVALFPGQGSQTPAMGKSLCENFREAALVFEEASDFAKLDLKKLCFEGDEKELSLTENTQPALLTVSIAAYRVARKEMEFAPIAVAGHSLGEYSALVAAGAIELRDAIRMVRERGLAMQSAVPVGVGGMTAVLSLADELVELLCKKASEQSGAIVVPANFNAPSQVVISGQTEALVAAEALLKTDPEFKGGKAIRLPVSAPFHSPLMSPATARMREVFDSLGFKRAVRLDYPILPNATARMHEEPTAVRDLLLRQIESPVLWKASIEASVARGYTTFIEFGSGKVLQGLNKRISKDTVSFGISDVDSVRAVAGKFRELSTGPSPEATLATGKGL